MAQTIGRYAAGNRLGRVDVLLTALALGAAFVSRPAWSDQPAAEVARSKTVASKPAPSGTAAPGTVAPLPQVPPPLTHYKGREIATTMHYLGASWLTRESRQREEDCAAMLAALEIKPGHVVCDMGCGNGFYTVQLARLVGDRGSVLAVDIQPEMLRMLEDRARHEGLANIKPIVGTPVDPGLRPGSVDLVLLVDVYHEFSYPEQMLGAIRSSLKPGGRMVLVEFRLEDPEVPIKLLHKMTKQQILKEVLPSGFRLSGQYDKLPWQHMMFFTRDDAPRPPPIPVAPCKS